MKNKAAVYAEPGTGKIEIVDLPIPKPAPGEILVEISYSSVCHTDFNTCAISWSGHPFIPPKGRVGGHEGVGTVVQHGEGVSHPPLGARVGIKWYSSVCEKCEFCLRHEDVACPDRQISGCLVPGTFQRYATTSATYATPIPDGISSADAAPLLCAGLTAYAALKKGCFQAGQWVVVVGAGGGTGHLTLQYARAMGLRTIAIDSVGKEAICRRSGAEAFFAKDLPAEELRIKVRSVAGNGAHGVVVCTASMDAFDEAMTYLRYNGTLVCVGMPYGTGRAIAGAVPYKMIFNQYSIHGSAVGNRVQAIEALAFGATGAVKAEYTMRRLDELEQIFQEMVHGEVTGKIVFDMNAEAV